MHMLYQLKGQKALHMYDIYRHGKTTELYRPVLKYSPVGDRKEVSPKTCSVTVSLHYIISLIVRDNSKYIHLDVYA